MPQDHPEDNKDFIIEKIKERPINRKRLIRRTIITASMAVLFGCIACATFAIMEPIMNKLIYPPEVPNTIVFPEDTNEMSPEEMLADNMQQQQSALLPDEISGEDTTNEKVLDMISGVTTNIDSYSQLFQTLTDYSKLLKHSVVSISGNVSSVDWLENEETNTVYTDGVIIYKLPSELLILADYKPLENASNLTVTMYNNVSVSAKVKEIDPETNLAVFSISNSSFSGEFLADENLVAQMGSTNLRGLEGTPVVILGRPMGVENSFGYGIITATAGEMNLADMNYKILQTNVYGSSKAEGVLFNLKGEMLGILTDSQDAYDMDGVLCAYGISSLKKRVEKLSNGESIPYLGIIGSSISLAVHTEQGMPYGAYIKEVVMDSPAMKAGLLQGDVITLIDDKNLVSFNDLSTQLLQKKPGQSIKLTVYRRSQDTYKEMKIDVVLEELQ